MTFARAPSQRLRRGAPDAVETDRKWGLGGRAGHPPGRDWWDSQQFGALSSGQVLCLGGRCCVVAIAFAVPLRPVPCGSRPDAMRGFAAKVRSLLFSLDSLVHRRRCGQWASAASRLLATICDLTSGPLLASAPVAKCQVARGFGCPALATPPRAANPYLCSGDPHRQNYRIGVEAVGSRSLKWPVRGSRACAHRPFGIRSAAGGQRPGTPTVHITCIVGV
jgi:hypothetical protein